MLSDLECGVWTVWVFAQYITTIASLNNESADVTLSILYMLQGSSTVLLSYKFFTVPYLVMLYPSPKLLSLVDSRAMTFMALLVSLVDVGGHVSPLLSPIVKKEVHFRGAVVLRNCDPRVVKLFEDYLLYWSSRGPHNASISTSSRFLRIIPRVSRFVVPVVNSSDSSVKFPGVKLLAFWYRILSRPCSRISVLLFFLDGM